MLFFCNSLAVALLNHKNKVINIQIPTLTEQEGSSASSEEGLFNELPAVPMQ
ncbi:hypothetical protein [Candidatus Xenohaliotis californiensis]|uniref:hypothetical protein n=1 Tax=Candidatus Xenohaliotis californiensis TaxID=84677 RepID=UPI0030C8694F